MCGPWEEVNDTCSLVSNETRGAATHAADLGSETGHSGGSDR